jgi:hypothetical protein
VASPEQEVVALTRPARIPGPRPAAPLLAAAVALLLTLAASGAASAQTVAWLDAPPQGWNRAGASLPPPPQASVANTTRCIAQERAPGGAEESVVAAAGWRLTTYWPAVRAGDLAVVLAAAGYDGMCRPIGYHAFVFAGGRYAGTLTPEPMNSRTDGALAGTAQGPSVTVGGARIEARFVRYAPTDPLCCPSRGHTRVVYRIERGPAGPVAVPDALLAEPAAPSGAATQLPRTGAPGLAALAAFGALLALGGASLRSGRRSGAPARDLRPGPD